MSTITAPAPSVSVGRRPFRVLTVVVVGAALLFAAFAVTRYLTHSSTVAVVPSVNVHDAVEHHADVAAASARLDQHDEHLRADMATPRTFAGTPTLVGRSVADEQIGGALSSYALAGRPARPQLAREQIGGAQPTYPLSPTRHVRWTNTWVPPYDDPTWAPWIHAHYYGTPLS